MSSEAVSKVELMEINMGRFNSTKWPVNGTGVAQKINNKFITEKKKTPPAYSFTSPNPIPNDSNIQ